MRPGPAWMAVALVLAAAGCDRGEPAQQARSAKTRLASPEAPASAPGAAAMATPAVPYDERAGVALAPADNAPLLLARNAARESLGHFWSAQRKGGRASDFSLKVTFDTPQGQQEHIWTNAIQRDGDTITGVIANTPLNVPSLRPGQRVIIDPARIYDWAYTRDGKLYGHFTSRVLLDGMPAAEAAPIRAQLSTTPLPAEAG